MPTSPANTVDSETVPQPTPASHPKGAEAQDLMRRAPMGYLWNQIGSLLLFGSSFLFTIAVARTLGQNSYGVLAVALTVYNTAVYVTAFGLEDASTVFVPRTLAEQGRAATGALIRRVLATRAVGVLAVTLALVWGIRALATLMLALHLPGGSWLDGVMRVPGLDALALPVAAYAAGTGIMNLLGSIFTSILRTRLTTTVNGLAQVANLALAVLALRAGAGIAGVLWVLALVQWVGAVVYLALLAPFFVRRGPRQPVQSFAPVLRLGGAAWITNLISGALLKQSAISLLQFFLISYAAIGYFNLAFQLSHAAAALLIAGLGGVGMAAMSAAYSGEDRAGLAFAWRAVSKVQILLAVPLLAFCFIHAGAIATALYGAQYTAVGPLMQIFLVFNIAQRLAGGGSHQAALYVLGRQRLVLITQYAGIAATIALCLLLIPRGGAIGGPAGALIAVGIGQVGVETAQLVMAWRFLRRKYPLRFGLRVCLALILPVLLAVFWHPSAWLRAAPHLGPIHVSLTLTDLIISVIGFGLVLVVGLYFAKPIEHEDVDLLAQVNPRLRGILSPFASGAPSPRRRMRATPTRRGFYPEPTHNPDLPPPPRARTTPPHDATPPAPGGRDGD